MNTASKIGEAGPREKQSILYLFDYGDEWAFSVSVSFIEQEESVLRKPVLVKSVGEAPEQYAGRDE